MIPQSVILWYSENILIGLGLPEVTSRYAATFIRILLPSLWFECQRDLMRRFLASQKEFKLMLHSQIISSALHPCWMYLTVKILSLGFEGVALANSLTISTNFLLPVLAILYDPSWVQEGSWHWFTKDSFIDLIQYLRFGIPSLLVVSLELWGFEAINILAGYLGVYEMGACSIVFEIIILFFILALGMSFPCSSLVGNSLGSGKAGTALVYAKISILLSFALGI